MLLVNNKKDKTGVFGRPLVPYFLNSPDEKSCTLENLKINESLSITEEHKDQQKKLYIPNNSNIRVREFSKDGYFQYKDMDLEKIVVNENIKDVVGAENIKRSNIQKSPSKFGKSTKPPCTAPKRSIEGNFNDKTDNDKKRKKKTTRKKRNERVVKKKSEDSPLDEENEEKEKKLRSSSFKQENVKKVDRKKSKSLITPDDFKFPNGGIVEKKLSQFSTKNLSRLFVEGVHDKGYRTLPQSSSKNLQSFFISSDKKYSRNKLSSPSMGEKNKSLPLIINQVNEGDLEKKEDNKKKKPRRLFEEPSETNKLGENLMALIGGSPLKQRVILEKDIQSPRTPDQKVFTEKDILKSLTEDHTRLKTPVSLRKIAKFAAPMWNSPPPPSKLPNPTELIKT